MIRILFDEHGNSHGDISFKIDASPAFIQVVDLYFVGDFLSVVRELVTKEELMIEFINYVKARFQKSDNNELLIPIDLSDEYVGGLLVTRGSKDVVKVKYGWTREIAGYHIQKDTIDKIMADEKLTFKIDGEWIMPISEIINGLNWSIERIRNVQS